LLAKETSKIKDSLTARNASVLAPIVAARGLAYHNEESPEFQRGYPMHARKLSDDEISKLMTKLPGWKVQNGKLHREYECRDFVTAFGNMTRVALIAESMNHHPEWFNVWNKVVIDLVTHSVKGISDLDFVFAEKVEEVFSGALAKQQSSGS